jgi:hypothetical protein
MRLSHRQRWIVLGGLLTATLAVAGWVSEDDAEFVAPAARPARDEQRRVAAQREPVQVNVDRLKGRSLGAPERDPFDVPAPRRPKPKPAAPAPVVVAPPPSAPAPPPSAPPLPFVYMGKLENADGTTVFLIQGDRNLVVKQGEVIDQTYRVDSVTSTEIMLVYLPLGQRQVLALGEAR